MRIIPSDILDADKTTFGEVLVAARISQVFAQFDRPIETQPVVISTTGEGAVTRSNGIVCLNSGLIGSVTIKSSESLVYAPGRETYALFTATFTPTTNIADEETIGPSDEDNGFSIGYIGLSFGVVKRSGGIATFVPRNDFNLDPLNGSPASRFTRNGELEALKTNLLNVYRIRFGWLGGAPTLFEVLSPDDVWIAFHSFLQPNSMVGPSIQNPNPPMMAHVAKTGVDMTLLKMSVGSWDAGITASPSEAVQLVSTTQLPLMLSDAGNLKVEQQGVAPLSLGAATDATVAASNAILLDILARLDFGPAASYRHISTNTTTTCKAGAGRLRSVIVNKAGTGNNKTIVTDGTNVIAVIASDNTPRQINYDILFVTDLKVETVGGMAPDLTIIYD